MSEPTRLLTQRRRLLAILAMLPATACAPMPLRVFEPDVPAADRLTSPCAFNGHVPAGARLAMGAARLNVRVDSRRGRTVVALMIEVPRATTLRFVDHAITAYEPGRTTASARGVFSAIHLVDADFGDHGIVPPALQAMVRPMDWTLAGDDHALAQGDLRPPAPGPWRHFWLMTPLELTGLKAFELVLPTLLEDARVLHAPRVRFQSRTVLGVALLNC
jgi:hypothetical protein